MYFTHFDRLNSLNKYLCQKLKVGWYWQKTKKVCVILCVPDLQAAERPPIYQPISLRWNSPAPGAGGGQGFTVTIITVSTHILSLQEPAPALLSVSLITTFLPIYNGGGTTQQNKPEKLLQASNFNLLTSTSWNLQWILQTLFRPKIPQSVRKNQRLKQTKDLRIILHFCQVGIMIMA